jgi:hypothetical protein
MPGTASSAATPSPGAGARARAGLLPTLGAARAWTLRELKRRADDALQLAFRLQAPAWPRRGRRVVEATRRDVEAALRLLERRGWLDDPCDYHRTPGRIPRIRVTSAHVLGRSFERVELASGFTPPAGHPGASAWRSVVGNRTAHAAMLRHREMDRPWVVCLHGYGMGTPAIDLAVFDASRLHRELGLNVLCAVLPFHGARAIGSSGPGELITSGITQMMLCHAQATWDVRRLLSWLRARGAGPVALHGVSLGANVAGLVAGLEPDLAAVLAGVPATDFVHSYRSAAAPEPGSAVPWREDPIWDDLRTALRVISPRALPPVLARERIAIYAGEVDGVVPAESVRALWQHWDRPELSWYPGGHLGFFLERAPRALVDRRLRSLVAA